MASRTIQLSPPYTDGPVLKDGAVIPIERTQVPVEWDQLRESINGILRQLGPTEEQPEGPFGELIEKAADNLAGKGKQIHDTLNSLSEALTALNEGRGDFVSITRSLAQFITALYQNDQQFVALNDDLAEFTDWFTKSDHDVADTITRVDDVLELARKFVSDNRSVLGHDVNNLADATTALLQPEPRDGLETALHVLPTFAGNFNNIYYPAHSSLVGMFALPNFANPIQFICSSIQAGSRLGLSGLRRTVRAVPGAGSGHDQVQLLAGRRELFRHGGHLAQGGRLLRAPAAPAAGIQGHHRPGDFLARTHRFRTAIMSRAGSSRPGCRAQGSAVHGEHADPGVAGRADGWSGHRTAAAGKHHARTAERL